MEHLHLLQPLLQSRQHWRNQNRHLLSLHLQRWTNQPIAESDIDNQDSSYCNKAGRRNSLVSFILLLVVTFLLPLIVFPPRWGHTNQRNIFQDVWWSLCNTAMQACQNHISIFNINGYQPSFKTNSLKQVNGFADPSASQFYIHYSRLSKSRLQQKDKLCREITKDCRWIWAYVRFFLLWAT